MPRRALWLLAAIIPALGLASAGCDAGAADPAPGVVEGTYELADGATGAFRAEGLARAFRYSGIGTRDQFTIGTRHDPSPLAPGETRVQLQLSYDGIDPSSGFYSQGLTARPGRPLRAAATVVRADASGGEAPVSLYYPDAELTMTARPDRVEGTFELVGAPDGYGRDVDGRSVRLAGRFEIPYEAAR